MAGSLITSQRSWPGCRLPLQYAQTLAVVIHNGLKNGAYAKHRSAGHGFPAPQRFPGRFVCCARVVEVLYDLHETMQGLYIINCFRFAIVYQKCSAPTVWFEIAAGAFFARSNKRRMRSITPWRNDSCKSSYCFRLICEAFIMAASESFFWTSNTVCLDGIGFRCTFVFSRCGALLIIRKFLFPWQCLRPRAAARCAPGTILFSID